MQLTNVKIYFFLKIHGTGMSVGRKCARHGICSMLLLLLFFFTGPAQAECERYVAYNPISVSFPASISVPVDAPIGYQIASASTLGNSYTIAPGQTTGIAQCPDPVMTTGSLTRFTSAVPGYTRYNWTNIPGVAIEIVARGVGYAGYFIQSIPFSPILTYVSGTPITYGSTAGATAYDVYLVKMGDITSGGSLAAGQIATTGFDNHSQFPLNIAGITTINPVSPTCSLSTASATFDMGALKTTDFNKGAGGTYGWVTDQSLVASSNCNTSTASMTFAGTADTGYPNAFKNNGSAKGVALELWKAGTPQVIPNSTTPITFAAGPNQNFTFSARYIQTEPTVTAGSVSATVTVTVNYQ